MRNYIFFFSIFTFLYAENCVADGVSSSDSIKAPFYFRFDNALLLADYHTNRLSFEELDSVSSPDNLHRAERTTIAGSSSTEGSSSKHKPIFVLKTNLLFDAATLLNLEVEVPLGRRWSVAGEWIFPWWLWEKKQNCLQVQSGNLEGKYWLGDRNRHEMLTGWYVGLYTGGGYYDLERNKKGYQGEFFVATGISGGFSHKIARNLHLEYTLGIGFMRTKYHKYEAESGGNDEWHLYRSNTGRYTWVGPTRARISLVWVINGKSKKR